ncbi:Lsr2 family protein [Streptomyces sp. NPDC052496]|uniref:histone-like nucleoid-structuring protein Lsr2 n=1 Tax=Streptomyces sp. NPDC052496 TaxID=3154951 RepID=UPI003448E298
MAQKIVTIYTDDLTGEESAEVATHSLAVDGIAYEVDLAPDSYDKLLEAIGPFLKAGRRTGRVKAGAAGARKVSGSASGSGETAKIRAWAKENGYEVNERGRVSADIREAYQNANK